MKNNVLLILCVFFTTILVGQVYEIGASLGGSNFIGDIGRTSYIHPNQLAGSIFFKYNYNPRIALKSTYSYLPIKGNDVDADTDIRRNRGLTFTNIINELAVGLEFNFYEYDAYSEDKNWTPYITIELAGYNYKTVASEIPGGGYNYTNSSAFTVPFGIGFKSTLFGKFAYALETKVRYAFKDDLDYSSERISALNFKGTGNDWYVFTGFSLIYTFGRQPCYTKGL